MINFDITEYSFSKKDTDQYQLSILYGVDSFAYIIRDGKANVLALREYYWPEGKRGTSPWDEDHKLQCHYRLVNVAFGNGVFCMVPQRLFREAEKLTYLAHLSQVDPASTVFSDNLSQHQAELVYQVDEALVNEVTEHFSYAQKKNLHTVLLEAMRSHAATQTSYHLAAHVSQKQVLIYAFDRTNLMLANAYTYRSAQDFIYYVLLVYDQLGIKASEAPLYLSGRVVEDSEIYRLLHRYVQTFSFLPANNLNRGPQLERYPGYFFYDLYALATTTR